MRFRLAQNLVLISMKPSKTNGSIISTMGRACLRWPSQDDLSHPSDHLSQRSTLERYCTNEMKWQATERVKGVRDYTKGDQIRAKFDSWNIPLSGNTLLWEVDHKATPQWYKNEINSLIDAGEDTEPLSEHVLFHVKERFSQNYNF